jgi:hypothetical protein
MGNTMPASYTLDGPVLRNMTNETMSLIYCRTNNFILKTLSSSFLCFCVSPCLILLLGEHSRFYGTKAIYTYRCFVV